MTGPKFAMCSDITSTQSNAKCVTSRAGMQ